MTDSTASPLQMSKPIVLVTGASGFIGRHVCAALAPHAFVRALVRADDADTPDAQRFIASDITDRKALQPALRGVQTVVHLAGRAHIVRRDADGAREFERVNVTGTRVLLEEAVRAGVARIIFASSVKAVGEENVDGVRWRESTPPSPVGAYGASKLAAEELVLAASGRHGLQAAVLRLPLVYGPGMRAHMLQLFRLVDRRVPLPFGDIQNRRSLIYVGNVAAAIVELSRHPSLSTDTYFVSDDHDVSTPELILAIAEALGRRPLLVHVPPAVFQLTGRIGDHLARFAPVPINSSALRRLLGSLAVDTTKINQVVGFVPPFTMQQGMRTTAAWYRSTTRGPLQSRATRAAL